MPLYIFNTLVVKHMKIEKLRKGETPWAQEESPAIITCIKNPSILDPYNEMLSQTSCLEAPSRVGHKGSKVYSSPIQMNSGEVRFERPDCLIL